eukprot:scaffold8481_cov33-Attheya_sp.AAC.2
MDLPTQGMDPNKINWPLILLICYYCTCLILITVNDSHGTTQADGDGSKWHLTSGSPPQGMDL